MNIKSGDIIGWSGRSSTSTGINLVTYGIPYISISHVGIVADYHGDLAIFESLATPTQPCVVRGELFAGTQAHWLDAIAEHDCRVYHYPLYRPLYKHERRRLTDYLLRTTGIPYDKMGAFRAGGLGLSTFSALFRKEDLSSLFCSEWTAAALSNIGVMPTTQAGRWSPNRLTRYGRKIGVYKRPIRLK